MGELLLISSKDYGILTNVHGGFAYFPDDRTVLANTDTFLRFKDYKELIEEAKLQFPDAALSEEKKHKYFIE